MGRDSYRVEFVQTPLDRRAEAITSGEVDVMFNAYSRTMDREVYEASVGKGITFGTPHSFITLAFGGDPKFVECAEDSVNIVDECSDLRICVDGGTRQFDELVLQLPRRQIVDAPSYAAAYDKFMNNTCNVFIAASFLEFKARMAAANFTGDFTISDASRIGLEPLAPATRTDDPEWSRFVELVDQGWAVASLYGITQKNIEYASHTSLDDTNDRSPAFVRTDAFGEEYRDMFYDSIAVGGNFIEMYNRTMNPEIIPFSILNNPVNGNYGVMYSLPFGLVETEGPDPQDNGTLAQIVRRGRLICGITMKENGFTQILSRVNGTHLGGMDVDYCRAIAMGALGATDLVEFVEVATSQEGFVLLNAGEIDVLSGAPWNFETYIREPSTGVGFSFSRPYFYNNSVAHTIGR